MKTLHLMNIVMLIFGISLLFITGAFAQNDASTHSPSNDLGDGNVFIMVAKDLFLPGDLVEINGSLVTTNPIKIILDDPHGEVVASKTTFSDRDGYFISELKIPVDAMAGTWKIIGTSGIYHKELNFTINGNSYTSTCYAGYLCSTPIGITSTNPVIHGMNLTNIQSPLKQFKSGITANDVKCKQGLELVIKAEDNSPACVKLDAAYMLIKRGWAASESVYPGGDAQFVLGTNSTIIPAHLPRSSGLQIPYYEPSRVINYSGFDGMYNETFLFRGTQKDYVLKPGSTGVITFKLEAVDTEQQGQDYPVPLPKFLNLTNYAIFYHEITSLEDLSKYPGVTFSESDHLGGFTACSKGPAGGGACIGGSSGGTNSVEAFVTDHPGVDVLFEPPSEMLPLSMNATSHVVTMMITADSNAPRGTYLVMLPSVGVDSFLLTVGNQPYHE